MRNNPQLSVVVPVYNAGSFFTQCLDSILAQPDVDFELILIDDGSTDDSGAICDEYARRDARVQVTHIPNGGVYPARNLGINKAKGRFLTFVDADDYLEPDAFGALLKGQREHNADFVQGGFRIFYDSDVPETYLGGSDILLPPLKGIAYIEDDSQRKPRIHFSGGPVAFIVSMKLLRDRGLRFGETRVTSEDAHFLLKLAEYVDSYHHIGKNIYNYRRQTQNSLTSTYSATKTRRVKENMEALTALREYLKKNYPAETVDAAIGNTYVGSAIRYLVACGADDIAGYPKARERFREMFHSTELRKSLPFYDSRSHKGKSWLLPLLIKADMWRTAFHLCKYKAKKRYARDLFPSNP